jgi:type VI secretion system protein ImpJ
MHNMPVHGSEGMFLRPQHFQAAERCWAETLQTSEHWDHQYFYGIRNLELSPEAIANYQVQVNVCHARMKDGTLITLDPGQELDRVDLKEAFAKESTVRVYLAVPKLKMGIANVATGKEPGLHRYVETTQAIQDESAGGNDQEIQFRRPNVKLLLSTQDMAGYEVLPLVQIQRAGQREAAPQIDVSYAPPMLAIDAWPPLGLDIVRAIYDILGKKIEVLSEQVLNRGITLASLEPGDLDRLLMLSQLNIASSTLGVLAFASGVHPFTAYTELCRTVGRLAIFGPKRRVPDLPKYDHDDLARIFRYVKEQIELLLGGIRDYEYEQRFFVGEGKGMRVSLETKWLGADWQWFVGVLRGALDEKECLALLSPSKPSELTLDWKLGSTRQVDALFEYGAEGLHLTPLPQAPRALPPGRDWLYFEVSRQNAAWKDVLQTQTLAMRLKDALIVNRNELQGERKIVVSYRGKQMPLHFALFAVPNRQ